MEPLYDSKVSLVGWLDADGYIFDTSMNWVAFVADGNAWSSSTLQWLGPVLQSNCLDRTGKVVAWSPDHPVDGSWTPNPPVLTPPRPVRPATPSTLSTPWTPCTPWTPTGGWSPLSWQAWLSQ